jgi:hypothetical protein
MSGVVTGSYSDLQLPQLNHVSVASGLTIRNNLGIKTWLNLMFREDRDQFTPFVHFNGHIPPSSVQRFNWGEVFSHWVGDPNFSHDCRLVHGTVSYNEDGDPVPNTNVSVTLKSWGRGVFSMNTDQHSSFWWEPEDSDTVDVGGQNIIEFIVDD